MVKVCLLVWSMKAKFDLIRWKLEIDVGAQFVAYWDHDDDALILAIIENGTKMKIENLNLNTMILWQQLCPPI